MTWCTLTATILLTLCLLPPTLGAWARPAKAGQAADMEMEPAPATRPKGYELRWRLCKLVAETGKFVEPEVIEPSVWLKKFTLVDGECLKGRKFKSGRCAKGTRKSRSVCLYCELPKRYALSGHRLPIWVKPTCMDCSTTVAVGGLATCPWLLPLSGAPSCMLLLAVFT